MCNLYLEPWGTWCQVSGGYPEPPRSFIGRTPSFSSCWGKTQLRKLKSSSPALNMFLFWTISSSTLQIGAPGARLPRAQAVAQGLDSHHIANPTPQPGGLQSTHLQPPDGSLGHPKAEQKTFWKNGDFHVTCF